MDIRIVQPKQRTLYESLSKTGKLELFCEMTVGDYFKVKDQYGKVAPIFSDLRSKKQLDSLLDILTYKNPRTAKSEPTKEATIIDMYTGEKVEKDFKKKYTGVHRFTKAVSDEFRRQYAHALQS